MRTDSYVAVKCLYDCPHEGDILMDDPHTGSWHQIEMWDADMRIGRNGG